MATSNRSGIAVPASRSDEGALTGGHCQRRLDRWELAAANDTADHWRKQYLSIERRDDERFGITVVMAPNVD